MLKWVLTHHRRAVAAYHPAPLVAEPGTPGALPPSGEKSPVASPGGLTPK